MTGRSDGSTRGGSYVVVWVSFAHLLAGVNLINPMLASLRSSLDIGAGAIAGLYGVYLIALVPMLMTLPRVVGRSGARPRLAVAVLLMVAADLLHVLGSLPTMAAGRVCMAAGVALGTGAAAELAVRAAGERGRTVTATANTGGALIGTIAGGSALLLSTEPVTLAFAVHAVCGLSLLGIIWRFRSWDEPAAAGTGTHPSTGDGGGRLDGVLLGGFAFAGAGAGIVLGPTLLAQTGPELGARTAVVPLLLFVGAAIAQRLARPSRFAIVAFGLLLTVGLSMMLAAVVLAAFWLLVLSAAVTGVGFGAVFMLGLAWTTRGADHTAQGSLASTYACTAYAFAGVVIIGGGFAADLTSAATALVVIFVVLAAILVLWVVLAHGRPDPFKAEVTRDEEPATT